jgi:hypothetical protein
MHAIVRTAPPTARVQLEQPFAVLTALGIFGAVELALLIAGLAAATLFYTRMFDAPLDRRSGSIAALTALAVVASAWLVPVGFSSDVYAYAVYGETALRGLDPFARQALSGGDPLTAAARVQWGPALPACVYGWGFVATAAAVVRATAAWGVTAQIAGLRVLASLAALACGALAFAAFSGDRAGRLRAAVLIGCNPVTLWCAVEGHNDALAVAVGLAGCALARRRPQWGAALAGAAGAFKLPAVAAAGMLAVRRPRSWIGAAVGLAIACAAMWPVAAHLAGASNAHGEYAPNVSLQALAYAALVPMLGAGLARGGAIALACIAAGALTANALTYVRRGDREGWVRLALAAWLLVPNPYPWYGLWLTVAAAMAPRSRACAVVVWVTLASLLRYLPDAAGNLPLWAGAGISIAAILPYALLLSSRGSDIINRPT